MEKLKSIKNYHLGMGLLVLIIQMIFQISDAIYFFGLTLILFSLYESMIIKKIKLQEGDIEKIRKTLKQFKWLNLFTIIPILLITALLITDIKNENFIELILSNPVFWINALVIGGIVIHLALKFQTKKIEKEIINS